MGSSSDEESDISDSEINEYKQKPYELLKAGTYKVKGPNGSFRCPFCAGKKKQDYQYNHLFKHAIGVAKGAASRSAKQKANHLALATFLENDLADQAEPLLHVSVPLPASTPQKKNSCNGIVGNSTRNQRSEMNKGKNVSTKYGKAKNLSLASSVPWAGSRIPTCESRNGPYNLDGAANDVIVQPDHRRQYRLIDEPSEGSTAASNQPWTGMD